MTTQPHQDTRLNLQTSGSEIVVTLIHDIAIDLDVQAKHGQVSSDFPVGSVIQENVSKSRLKGTVNGGGPLLQLQTSNGNIRLKMVRK